MPMPRLVQLAEESITNVFTDTTVAPETTLERLYDLQLFIGEKVDALRADVRRKKGA